MNLEQVKEHFKYAKEVRCAYNGEIMNIGKLDKNKIHYGNDAFWIDTPYDIENNCMLFNVDTNKLAEILTYIFYRGEEVEVKDLGEANWKKYNFLTFTSENLAIVEYSNATVGLWHSIRKITPESLLEPQLTALKQVAESNGMTVEIIFNKK